MSRTAAFHNGNARLNVAVPLHAPAALLVVELDQLVRTWRDDTDLVLAMAGGREVVLDGFFDVEERAILTRDLCLIRSVIRLVLTGVRQMSCPRCSAPKRRAGLRPTRLTRIGANRMGTAFS